MIEQADEIRAASPRRRPARETPVLLDPRTAALNQNDQHNNSQYCSDNLDRRGTHIGSSHFQ
jgi:hypothetical protein